MRNDKETRCSQSRAAEGELEGWRSKRWVGAGSRRALSAMARTLDLTPLEGFKQIGSDLHFQRMPLAAVWKTV